MTKPCVVCQFPVEIEDAQERVFIDPDNPIGPVVELAVCGSERCQRLLFEAIEEEARREAMPQ